MRPLTQSLTTAFLTSAASATPLDLKGSDGRLEVVLKPGSLDLSHAVLTTGGAPKVPLTLHITQQYGNFVAMIDVLGTYTLQVVDSTGQSVSGIVMREPATFIYHYRPKELYYLNLDADHLTMTWPGQIATAQKAKQPDANLIIYLQNDSKNHTLTGQSSVLGSGPFTMGDGSSTDQSPPVPHLASVQGNTGQLSYAYPLQVPPGPGGFAPQLSLTYSSSEPNGRTSRTSPANYVGDGWSLSLGSVSSDNYPSSSAGSGTWYFLNDAANVSDRLAPNLKPGDPNNPDFLTEHISQLKVIEANANTTTPSARPMIVPPAC